ncbi:uncharacterized protein LOC131426960 [Malaya genurostris]|uniref:uncharacterized protein LOC131426960 n=1 Tax=Malaya genurostris TaxID=325434 RepID=UPI0026F3F5E6|nr:uncharacterized protein LOC131426960 [Malaya genurostris]
MGEQYETRDPWLIHLLLKKLDDSLRSQWAQHIVDNDYPTFNELLRFLKRKCDALETCAAFGTKSIDYMKRDIWKDERVSQIPKKEVRSLTVVQNVPCPMCTEDHTIYQCNNFKEASVQERRDLVQKAKLCFNCLRSNHFAKTCQSKSVCRNPDCKQRHHTLLCQMESNATSNQSEKSLMEIKTEDNNIQQMHSYSTSLKTNSPKYVVGTLPTAIVRIKGKDKYYEMRAMIDCGSQASLITESCVTRLGLHRANGNILITGVTNCASETTRGVVNLEISSRFNFNPIINTRAYVLNKLTRNLPQQKIDTTSLKCLESLPLADPGYDTPSKIDLILSVDVFLSILDEGKVKDDFGMPVAVNSLFGWLVAGQIGNSFTIQCSTAVMNLYTDIDVDRTLRQFWEIEEIVKPKHLTVEEKKTVEIFQSTHQRDDAGRFTVRLPMNDSSLTLGESLPAAIQRLKAMERRFSSDPNFKNLYSEFMTEYLRLGHMERVPTDEINIAPDKRYYLPHHAVLKEDSSTSKLRVVFDGSCRTSTGVSLNEKLLVGPNVNEELFVVLTRFRSYAVAFTADAEKMYRQVNVHKDDTDFQRIVWRFDPTQPIEHYRLLTVTYGTSCAAYLAMESLRQAAKDSQNESPIASERIRKNFYVDDLLSGANTLEEAIRLQNEIIKITSAAGFNLRKWSSNISQPNTIPEQSIPLKLSPETEYVKALGIHWSPLDDSFSYRLKLNIHNQNTKRKLLSDSARLFDPLGWISPVIVRIKILFQSLWLTDLSWDDPLPVAIDDEWNRIKSTLHLIEGIHIPRWIANHDGRIELHGFADASEVAYAAVVYARSIDSNGIVNVSLIASKTKVAPIQQVSLPRLELNAAVLLTELLKRILEAFDHLEIRVYAWTDSMIVLEWLSSHPRKWKTYIANRTSMILDLLPRSSWNHIPSADNPADCASRGLLPADLIDHVLWWTGPTVLYNKNEMWNQESVITAFNVCKQDSTVICSSTTTLKVSNFNVEKYLLNRSSSLLFIKRVLAWINRFKNNASAKLTGLSVSNGNLKLVEIQEADTQLIRCAQHDQFNGDLDHRQLRESLKSESFDASVSQYLNNLGIKWTFITPNAPHMGGLWEAAVKSMKKHLRVVLGNEILTNEALSTILAQIEACLNSRPLCALSTSVDACEALTPEHFTIGQALNLIPEPTVLNITENRLDRYQRLCRYVEEFWDRWKGEFLATLQPRSKWRGVQANLKIGDLVIVKNDNTPPAYWELARVIAVHPDRNGIVRNVTLSKGQTEYQRPIHKLVVLPRN